MGRGIEGTGNTKYAVEFQEYFEKQGYDVITFAENSKKWGREKSHRNKITLLSFVDSQQQIENRCNESDFVFVLSVPAKNYDFLVQDVFYDIIDNVKSKTKLIYIQVDHKIQSINRNFYSDEIFEDMLCKFDVIVTHSPTSDFVRFCNDRFLKIKKFVFSTSIGTGTINGINFSKYTNFITNNKKYRTIKFIGRSAQWKGPWLVRDLHNKYFREQGYITTLEGIEGSIQTVNELYKTIKPERIPRDDVSIHLKTNDKYELNNDKFVFERNMPVYVLPPYDNEYAMKRLAESQFGIELLLLEDDILDDIIEYAMLEMMAVGTIPVFRKRWGQMFKLNNTPIIELDSGIIFMDENNPHDAIEEMNKLSIDSIEYENRRNKVLEFGKKYFDSDVIFTKLMEALNDK